MTGMLRTSSYLMAASVSLAGLGFVFWVVNARLYPAAEIGVAATLLGAVSSLSYLSLFGLNNLLIRHQDDAGGLFGASLLTVGGAGAVLSLGYVLAAPQVSPGLRTALADPSRAGAFVVLTVAAALNVLTDAALVSRRGGGYLLAVDAGVGGLGKLLLAPLLVGLGAFGLVAGSAVALAAATSCALLVLGTRLHLVPRAPAFGGVRRHLRYALGTYLSSALNLVPLVVVPVLVLRGLGATQAGMYLVAFQIANLLTALCLAVGEALFAEGSRTAAAADGAGAGVAGLVGVVGLARSAGRLMALVVVSAVTAVVLAAPLVLALFGPQYVQGSTTPLRLLALGMPAVGLNVWASFLLKVTAQVRWLVASNVVYVLSVIGLTLLWLPHGVAGVAVAWGTGTAASALVAAVPAVLTLRGAAAHAGTTEECLPAGPKSLATEGK